MLVRTGREGGCQAYAVGRAVPPQQPPVLVAMR